MATRANAHRIGSRLWICRVPPVTGQSRFCKKGFCHRWQKLLRSGQTLYSWVCLVSCPRWRRFNRCHIKVWIGFNRRVWSAFAIGNIDIIQSHTEVSTGFSTCLFMLFGQGAVLGSRTPPSPTRDSLFPLYPASPKKIFERISIEKLTVVSALPPSPSLLFPVNFLF